MLIYSKTHDWNIFLIISTLLRCFIVSALHSYWVLPYQATSESIWEIDWFQIFLVIKYRLELIPTALHTPLHLPNCKMWRKNKPELSSPVDSRDAYPAAFEKQLDLKKIIAIATPRACSSQFHSNTCTGVSHRFYYRQIFFPYLHSPLTFQGISGSPITTYKKSTTHTNIPK